MGPVASQRLEIGLGQIFDVDEPIARAPERRHELVQLEMNRARLLVLRALDEEHHEERDDRRARVDDELPRVRVVEDRAGHEPQENHAARGGEGPRAPRPFRGP